MIYNIPKFVTNPNPDLFMSDNYLVFDFETTNLDKGDPLNENNHIILIAWQRNVDERGAFVRHPEPRHIERFLEEVERADFIVAHNAKFELGWLKRLGIGLEKTLPFCTQLAEYVLRSNRRGRLSLEECLRRRRLGGKESIISAMMEAGICPSEMPENWLKKYAKIDVEQTKKLFEHQRKELFKNGLERVFYTKCLQIPVIADIEFNGMCLDTSKVKEVYKLSVSELRSVERELDKFTGGLNPRSNKQMAEFIYDELKFAIPKDHNGNLITTPKGERSASSVVISLLKPKTKKQKEFIKLKQKQVKLNAQVTKSLEKFNECCEQGEGILHASINQAVTTTGRDSSTGKTYKCQFQNVDRGFKRLFRARKPSWLVGEADEAQLEFRVAVWYGRDNQGLRDIQGNFDVHKFTADIIYPRERDRGQARQNAKAHTFKPLYGGTSGTPSERRYYRAFTEKYRGITREQDKWVDEAVINKELTLPTGMKFYFPSLRVTHTGYVEGNTSVRNYPVQYLATAEIVPTALVYAWHCLKSANAESFITNTIHDSIICEIHPDERNLFVDVMSESLQEFPVKYMKRLYGIDFNIPLKAEIKTGTHWGS